MICIKCNTEKSDLYFYVDRSRKSGFHPVCRECQSMYWKEKRKNNPEWAVRKKKITRAYAKNNSGKYTDSVKNSQLKAKYGITLEEYNKMLDSQKGVCAVCGDSPTYQRLHVDHNHSNGKVRGLLCQACNVSIGKLKENPHLIRKLADYVENLS